MSTPDEHAVPRGSGQVLILGTFVLAVAAAAVLILGTQDARLLRLGLVAALWAALLATYAAARMRRESSSYSNQLRAVYQLELEREVTARREHALSVERQLREQAELSDRREVVKLRAELAAMRANLEQLLGTDPLAGRVMLPTQPARPLRLPAQSRILDNSGACAPIPAAAAPMAIDAQRNLTGAELNLGPDYHHAPAERSAPSPANAVISNGPGRRGMPNGERSGRNGNKSYKNSSHNNGGAVQWVPGEMPTTVPDAQRTVNDLLAAYGTASQPRRRRSRDDDPLDGVG
jgi:multidrug efflux pump subunit AcrA (membrane-fusion protein)